MRPISSLYPTQILEKVLNNAYGYMEEFDDSNFKDSNVVRVAFRTLGSRKHEHYLNTWAAKLTRHRGEKFPAGAMTHSEMIVALRPGVYLKASVIKKSYNGKDENGEIIWKKGCVHLKKTDPREWQDRYVFLTLHAHRRDIKRMTEFLIQQNGQDFHHHAYYANLLLPGGLGVKQYSVDLMNKSKPFFCTQFIVCGLQCLAGDQEETERTRERERVVENSWRRNIWNVNCATSNPNMLYRVLKGSAGTYDDAPLGGTISIV
jgi:hypothetical protein